MPVVVVITFVEIDIGHDNGHETTLLRRSLLPLTRQCTVKVPTVEEACQAIPEGEPLQFRSLIVKSLLRHLARRNVMSRGRNRFRHTRERVDDQAKVRFHPDDLPVQTAEAADR